MSTYQIDSAHTHAQFKVRHLMISNVKGDFDKVSGTVTIDDANHALSSVNVTVDVASVSTREPQRDAHLKSPDFFDVEKFPTITFVSKEVVKSGDDSFEVVGDLTIHGVTKTVDLNVEDVTPEVKDPYGLYRRGASAKTTIMRSDFGLKYNSILEAGGVAIGDEVHITIDTEFTRQA
ncbi:MAG TPA: YceI family protein [Bryobacteraceae bacterium]|jgi:polyisoprenoid-binding protein YceI|nr:YceI family protein [Bryobacteraceae bacterium]